MAREKMVTCLRRAYMRKGVCGKLCGVVKADRGLYCRKRVSEDGRSGEWKKRGMEEVKTTRENRRGRLRTVERPRLMAVGGGKRVDIQIVKYCRRGLQHGEEKSRMNRGRG